jgi:hypothetical protein
MARLFLFALALSCWALTAPEAFALGSDHPKGPVAGNKGWPEGLKELANWQNRVHGFWVNETDVFFYDGESKELNKFMEGYSKLKNTALHVVIHAGAKKARSPWDKAERDIPVAWSLHASFSPLVRGGMPSPRGRFYTRVDVWLGSRLKLEDLRIPAAVAVVSGGEIEKFIAEHRSRQKK